jgi:hypothetical protein
VGDVDPARAHWTELIDRLTATMTAGLAGDPALAADLRQAWLPDTDRRYLLRDPAAPS